MSNKLKDVSRLNSILTNLKPGILVIFLLSGYSLTQMLIGSVFLFIFPPDFLNDSINLAFFSLIVLLASNALLILILIKWKSFNSQSPPPENRTSSIFFLLFLLLIVSISIIEIIVSIIDFGLNFLRIDPTLATPYDEYFSTPFNLLVFTILITIFGPILEELIFRRYIISIMLDQCQSKFLVLCTSALIFSLSHTATNLIRSVRYAILHFFATLILGMVLAIIFLRWGLKYAILFHSYWNFYSLIIQLLINDGALQLTDLIISFFIIITLLILIIDLFFRFRRFRGIRLQIILPPRTIILLTSLNFFLIITYELIFPLVLLLIPSSILTAGLTFIYQVCAFLAGVILIDKENKRVKRLQEHQLDLDSLYDEIFSLQE